LRELISSITCLPETLSKLHKKLTDRKAGQDKDSLHNKLLIDSLHGLQITIKAKANEKGSLFKSITAKDIVMGIKNDLKISAPESIFEDYLHNKTLGHQSLPIESGTYRGQLNVDIVKE
jgi:ribosomal protein L9